MPTDLYKQLAAELGLSPDEAESVLRDFLRDVRERTASGEDVSVRDLGTFSMDEGTLRFTPSPPLQKAVNYRNDHLAPLTVRGSSEPPEASVPPPPPPEASEIRPDDLLPPEEEPSSPLEEEETIEAEAAEEETPLPPDEDEAFAPIEPPVEEEDAADTLASDDLEAPSLSDDWTEELEADAASQESPSTSQEEDATSATTGQLVAFAASIVLLAGLIWFVLGLQGVVTGPGALLGGNGDAAPAGADTVAATSAADPAGESEEEAATDDDADEGEAEEEDPEVEDAASADTPSMPPTIDRDAEGWTLVVASQPRPGDAKAVLETYQQRFAGENVPVDILTGTSGEEVRYRIAVGQYSSREDALAALEQLQDRLPDDAWLLRVQPNS